MKHIDEIRVYYADTDAYGVVWHGAYLRWMEAGRVNYTEKVLGLDLKKMQEDEIIGRVGGRRLGKWIVK